MKTVALFLDPVMDEPYRYRVMDASGVIGYVGRSYRMEQGWYFKNDARDWYGHTRTQRAAIKALIELASDEPTP